MTFIRDDRSHYICDMCGKPMPYAVGTIDNLLHAANDTRVYETCAKCWDRLDSFIKAIRNGEKK
jgi:hypothetical protein